MSSPGDRAFRMLVDAYLEEHGTLEVDGDHIEYIPPDPNEVEVATYRDSPRKVSPPKSPSIWQRAGVAIKRAVSRNRFRSSRP